MNTRLQQFLAAENISQGSFADKINVARASVSHILAGRNKPGYEFISSLIRHYPELNIEWLLTGKGKMYKNGMDDSLFAPLFESAEETENAQIPAHLPTEEENRPASTSIITSTKQNQTATSQRKAVKVVVFYDDGTYQEL